MKRIRVYIATREAELRDTITTIFSKLGEVVDFTTNLGKVLIKKLGRDSASISIDEETPIIVIDDNLVDTAGMDIVDLAKAIREDAKVIFIARPNGEEFERLIRKRGVNFLVQKPVDTVLFEEIVKKILEHETTRILRTRILEAVKKGR
jgi:DNA-binding response OmpR family regulator